MDLQKLVEEFNTEGKALIHFHSGGEKDEAHIVGDKMMILSMLVVIIENIAKSAGVSYEEFLDTLKKTKSVIDNANQRESDNNNQ